MLSRSERPLPIEPVVRRLVAIALCALTCPGRRLGGRTPPGRSLRSSRRRSGPARRQVAELQAAEAADAEGARRRARDALARKRGAELDYTLSPVTSSPGRAVTIRELDAALVGFLGLGDSARSVTAALRDAGLAPKAGAGTETIARLLGFRFNHPAAERHARARPQRPGDARRSRVLARPAARPLRLGAGLDSLADRSCSSCPELSDVQRQVLTRAVSFVGYPYVWGGVSEAPQQPFGKPAPGGFDCSGFVWRVFKLEPFPGASALASVLRGRTTYQMSGEVPPAQRIRKAENLQPGDLIFQGEAAEVEAGPGRSRGDLSRRRLVRALVRKRHHPPSVRRVVPRPLRLGEATAARSRARLARTGCERGSDVVQVVERLVATPSPSRWSASASRAKTRSAASAAQRSE